MEPRTEIRPLSDLDLPELLRFLSCTERRSFFLSGYATEHGLEDRGGRVQGIWLGAFDGPELRGAIAWFRGRNVVAPACEGHGSLLVPALAARLESPPGSIVGTPDRVEEVLTHGTWRPAKRERHVLFHLDWQRFRPAPAVADVMVLGPEHAAQAAELALALDEEWSIAADAEREQQIARERAERGQYFAVSIHGEVVALSTRSSVSDRFVLVGGTYTRPAHRRRGFAAACVTRLLERTREEGRASLGAVLFADARNLQAMSVYEKLGFRPEAPWEICELER